MKKLISEIIDSKGMQRKFYITKSPDGFENHAVVLYLKSPNREVLRRFAVLVDDEGFTKEEHQIYNEALPVLSKDADEFMQQVDINIKKE